MFKINLIKSPHRSRRTVIDQNNNISDVYNSYCGNNTIFMRKIVLLPRYELRLFLFDSCNWTLEIFMKYFITINVCNICVYKSNLNGIDYIIQWNGSIVRLKSFHWLNCLFIFLFIQIHIYTLHVHHLCCNMRLYFLLKP